jgi:hypothetical protein
LEFSHSFTRSGSIPGTIYCVIEFCIQNYCQAHKQTRIILSILYTCIYYSVGLEILEDLPDPDVVIVCCGGGGLLAGIASAIKLSGKSDCRIYGVEPEGGIKGNTIGLPRHKRNIWALHDNFCWFLNSLRQNCLNRILIFWPIGMNIYSIV